MMVLSNPQFANDPEKLNTIYSPYLADYSYM
jgi:hypothetical protein